MGHHWDPAAMHQKMQERHAARLKALHDVLGIRPDQEAAFQAFGAAMHHGQGPGADHQPGEGWKDHAAQAGMSTPDRLDARLKRFDERTAHMREALVHRAEAVKAFYAVLSPEQKRAFDALPHLVDGGDRDHGGWGGHGEGHGPKGPGQGMSQPGPGQ
jgi:hypothetical protein